MGKEICGNTKVTVKGKEKICKNFPEVWKFLEENGVTFAEEEMKTTVIRVLFIESKMDLTKYGVDVQMEIVWED